MDIVWFSEIKWDYLKTRKQQIVRRKPDNVRLLFLEPFVKGRENRYDLRKDGDIYRATVPFIKTVPQSPVRWFLDRKPVRDMIDAFARYRVNGLLGSAGFDPADTGLILSNVYAIHVADRCRGRFLLYDCNDAHSAFPGMPSWTEAYFEAACRKADVVFASSRALCTDAQALRADQDADGSGCEFLGNGVEYTHFESVRKERGWPDPPDPPCIGYLGAIAPWFNFEFVERVATSHPEWKIELVGPVMLGVENRVDRLARLPNVSVGEPVAYEDVPGVLRTFTTGIIPFRYDTLTRGVNPNKMYEYLAMGLPVVASRFSAEVQQYPDLVEAPETADEFVRACEKTVSFSSDPDRLARHRTTAVETAAGHDWALIAKRFWERVKVLGSG